MKISHFEKNKTNKNREMEYLCLLINKAQRTNTDVFQWKYPILKKQNKQKQNKKSRAFF